jgi:glycosyltransferase involved in cell wall biosynthesis/ribosomal protein S18 acetylase RimI-like enzyme
MHLTTVDMSLELLLGHQLRAARDEGYEVVGVSAPGPWVAALEAEGLRHVPLRSSTRGWSVRADVRTMHEFWRVLNRERPDILHTHNPKPGLYGRVLGRLARVPVVINTLHGLYAAPDDPVAKRAIFYLAEALAARFSDHELLQSREDLDMISRLHLMPGDHVSLLGNGIDLNYFDPARIDQGAVDGLRSELGLDTGSPVVGVVGRLVAEKGLPELFEALRRLRQRGMAFEVIVIGPADEDKADALDPGQIKKARAEGVRFLGLRHDMPELYRVMDLFVLASHREGFPRAAMEAAAMEIPIVATDIRGCREVVADGKNGLLVPVRDPRALEIAIGSLLSDSSGRERMGKQGREIALENFDVRRVAAIVLDTYRRVAERKGVRLHIAPLTPEKATSRDAFAIAGLHAQSIDSGFLVALGERFLRQLYLGLIADPGSVVLVARDAQGELAGFIAGTVETGRAYRRLVLRRAVALAAAALPALVAHPRRLREALETLRYGIVAEPHMPSAELLAMAVSERFRSQGIGAALIDEFLAKLSPQALRVVVGSGNERARRFYRSQGFAPVKEFEVHRGQRSEMLVWHSSPG